MLGNRLITQQTPPEGVLVNKLMLAESLDFGKEFYFAILLDRASGGPVFVASPMGGMDIEHVAEVHPEAIFKVLFYFHFISFLLFLFYLFYYSS